MRNKLAITMLMLGLTGAALAQDYSHDAPLTTDNPYANSKPEEKESAQNPDCNGAGQSSTTDKNPSGDRKDTRDAQAPDLAPQNVIEYGG